MANTGIDWNKAARILSGEASDREVDLFNSWLKENPKHTEEWHNVQEGMSDVDFMMQSENIDVDAAWEKVKKYSFSEEKKSFTIKLSMVAAVAAIIVFVVLFIVPSIKNTSLHWQQVASSENVMKAIVLPDGSVIDVNRYSVMKFPEEFEQDKRSVNLEGEAFFNVKPDSLKPFVINAGKIRIKVLGTSFNVKAYPNDHIAEVVVNSGVVEVSEVGEKLDKVILYPGDKAIFDNRNNTLIRIENTNVNYLSWKTMQLEFKNESLQDVIKTIEDVYNVEVDVPEGFNIDNARLTATFNQSSIDFVMGVISKTYAVDFSYKSN